MQPGRQIDGIAMPETLGVVRGEIHSRQILQQGVERQTGNERAASSPLA